MKHLAIALFMSVAIVAICWATMQYSIEENKQQAFMMSACVNAGGQWKKNFGPTWDCIRPQDSQP